jgi:hypothetical protein
MNETHSMNRRIFVRLAGLLVLTAPLAGQNGLLRRLVSAAAPDAAAAWRAVIPVPESARVLGQRYLATVPEEGDAGLLMQRLSTAVGVPVGSSEHPTEQLSTARLRELLKEGIQQDFERYDVVQLDGWVLARTECRLCALAVLIV